MNYRHAFHAGNHADVLKHVTLLALLARLKAKPAPFAVLDTHAGRGLYDLEGEEAQRGNEARLGVLALNAAAPQDPLLAAYRAAIAAVNAPGALRFYPGSPLLAANALRPTDRLIACEAHPEEARALRAALRGKEAQLHERDGYQAMRALLPFPERRGLILIDPPFEQKDEGAAILRALAEARRRFRQGIFMIWRPLKDARAIAAMDAEIPGPALRADLDLRDTAAGPGLAASSLLILNPPFGLKEDLARALPELAAALSPAAQASLTERP